MRNSLQGVLSTYIDAPLVTLDDEILTAKVHSLYQVLDDDRSKHGARGQSGTVLSKILHRKHPKSLPLHDKWVRRCYLGSDGVPTDKTRPWAEYGLLR
ncbi:DUF6308 family protein [Janibacter limosus]|uniref:DUF6308 family protein n=1 Tax=Janibacter limosus TaxID=53458 RepID=UPI002682E93B